MSMVSYSPSLSRIDQQCSLSLVTWIQFIYQLYILLWEVHNLQGIFQCQTVECSRPSALLKLPRDHQECFLLLVIGLSCIASLHGLNRWGNQIKRNLRFHSIKISIISYEFVQSNYKINTSASSSFACKPAWSAL